ncbi:uncharacterized protein [Dermacentor andersoni]|uniref:uncharacterized protein n=1 Tax=Dermacentor andersoni TaxID=34620 RepID=UPI002416368D|nr:uncharacterized protein LOC129381196 isoform X2 [Dermacentor andersoni]
MPRALHQPCGTMHRSANGACATMTASTTSSTSVSQQREAVFTGVQTAMLHVQLPRMQSGPLGTTRHSNHLHLLVLTSSFGARCLNTSVLPQRQPANQRWQGCQGEVQHHQECNRCLRTDEESLFI